MNSEKRLRFLIILPLINLTSPQPLRFIKLASHWIKRVDISILTQSLFIPDRIPNGIKIINVPFSLVGRLLIQKRVNQTFDKINNENKLIETSLVKKLKSKIFSFIRRILLPDIFVFEIKNYKKIIKTICNEYDVIIASAFPFSVMKLSKFSKNMNSKIKFIYDIGDPYFGNEANEYKNNITQIFAKSYENYYLKFIDLLVVTNEATKELYLRNFATKVSLNSILVIPQGTDPLEPSLLKYNKEADNNKIRLIHAGSFYDNMREPFNLYKAITNILNVEIQLDLFGTFPIKFMPDLNQSRIFYKGNLNHDKIISEYQKYDLIVLIDNAYGVQVPGKLFEIISLKKPILFIYSNDFSPSKRVLEEYGGVLMSKNNVESIKNTLLSFIEKKKEFDFNFKLNKYLWINLSDEYLIRVKNIFNNTIIVN